MKNKIAVEKIQPYIVYSLLPILLILTVHYLGTTHYGGLPAAVRWWAYFETKLNFFWHKYLPAWKSVLLGSLLINVLLLDLWITNLRRLSAFFNGNTMQPHAKPAKKNKALLAENMKRKQPWNVSDTDLHLNGQTCEEHMQNEWSLTQNRLEAQLEQESRDHEKTRHTFSELQEELKSLTQQLEQAKTRQDSSQLEQAAPDQNSSQKESGMQSQKFKSKLKNLKDFIDDNELA